MENVPYPQRFCQHPRQETSYPRQYSLCASKFQSVLCASEFQCVLCASEFQRGPRPQQPSSFLVCNRGARCENDVVCPFWGSSHRTTPRGPAGGFPKRANDVAIARNSTIAPRNNVVCSGSGIRVRFRRGPVGGASFSIRNKRFHTTNKVIRSGSGVRCRFVLGF